MSKSNQQQVTTTNIVENRIKYPNPKPGIRGRSANFEYMALHHQTGKTGEEIAAAYLTRNGYAILHTNYRHGRNEVDLIASKGNVLHFVEVKTKAGKSLGTPEQKVNKAKIERMKKVAEEYLQVNREWAFIQFDIISIMLKDALHPEVFIIEDVY